MTNMDDWLDTAVSGIRFRQDREAARRELLQHIEDKTADLQRIFPRMDGAEARNLALSGMGDPEEVKQGLARVHKAWIGWLWQITRWTLWGIWVLFLLFQMGTRTDWDSSLRGRTGTEVYHRIKNGESAQLGQYTFRITGAAYVDRPEEYGAQDSLQVVLRVSSPRFWERVDSDAMLDYLTAAGPDGIREPMNRHTVMQYTVSAEAGNLSERRSYILTGGDLCEWGFTWREFAVFLPAEGWQPGSRVTVYVDSPAGSIALSVPVTEKVAAR